MTKALLAAVLLFGVSTVANAQRPNMKVQILPSPTSEISIAPLTAENTPQIIKNLGNVHPSAFVLTNLSDRAIVGLAVEWIYMTPDGHLASGFHKSDSFFTKHTNVVVQPHAKLFVGPQVFIPESAFAPRVGASPAALDGSRAHWSTNTPQITVAVDAVIFEDGELVGPNHSQFDTEIQARKLAANQIASEVRFAQSKGQDPTAALRTIGDTAFGPNDFLTQWSARYAQRLLKAQSLDAQLTALDDTPTPPKFFRKTQ